MPHRPVLVLGLRYAALGKTIAELQQGAPSSSFEGSPYTTANLATLYALYERFGVKAAIEAIQQGAQSWSLSGTTYTRGDLGTLFKMDQTLTDRAAVSARGGIGVRYARLG